MEEKCSEQCAIYIGPAILHHNFKQKNKQNTHSNYLSQEHVKAIISYTFEQSLIHKHNPNTAIKKPNLTLQVIVLPQVSLFITKAMY